MVHGELFFRICWNELSKSLLNCTYVLTCGLIIIERLGYPVCDIEIGLAYHLLCRSRSRCWNIVSKVGLCRRDKCLLNACVYSPCLACGYAQCINLAKSYVVPYLRDTASLCRVTRTAQTRAMWETMTSTHSMVTSSSPIPFPLSETG